MEEKNQTSLPENATRELRPGEEYQPLLSPKKNYPEVTPWSVSVGLVMTIILSVRHCEFGGKGEKKLVDEKCEKAYIIDTNLYLFLLL